MAVIVLCLLAICFLISPYFLSRFFQWIKLRAILSDVVICFGFGILLGNTSQWWLPAVVFTQEALSIAEICVGLPVLLAIPMLLMISDIRAFRSYAPQLTLSFGMGVVSVMLAGLLTAWWWQELPLLAQTVGILTGVYIGGSPNMVAIRYATEAPESLFLILTATDIFCGGIYFLILTAVGTKFWSVLLPKFKEEEEEEEEVKETETTTMEEDKAVEVPFNLDVARALLLAIGCILVGAGAGFLFPNAQGKLNQLILIVVLTLVGTLLSFYDKIRNMKGVYEFAQYLLLIFAVAIGFMADFSTFLDRGGEYTLFNAIMVVLMVVIHFIGARIFGIDRDTFIVTSTACIYGPPFIGPICKVLNNRQLVGAGMALGVLGLVLGNYLGILMCYIIEILI